MKYRPIIGFDMDNTLTPFVQSLLPLYNAKYKDNVAYEDIKNYDIHSFLHPDCNVFAEFVDDDFILSLKPYKGAIEVVNQLHIDNDIYFVTAGHPKTLAARDKWLSQHFSWYKSMNIIACQNKGLLNLDILVDDCLRNFTNPDTIAIVYDSPWNRDDIDRRTARAYDYENLIPIIEKEKKIKEFKEKTNGFY